MVMLVPFAMIMAQRRGSRARIHDPRPCSDFGCVIGRTRRDVISQAGIQIRLNIPAAKKDQRHPKAGLYAKKTAKLGASPAPRLRPSWPMPAPTARSSGFRYIAVALPTAE